MKNLIFSLGVTGVGLAVVFAGLVILIGFIMLLGALTKEHKKPIAEAPKAEKAPEPIPDPAEEMEDEAIPAEVIAAITAAVAMVWQGETGFTVRHVKRIGNAPAWARAGREEQTYSRL